MQGMNLTDILYQAQWSPTSKAVEAYTQPELIDMAAQDIFHDIPRYRRPWSFKRLVYLACVTVESVGTALHPFALAVKSSFPHYLSQLQTALPQSFPHEGARL